MPDPSSLPTSEPRHGWFDGILEGPAGDRDAMRRVAARLDGIGLARCHLELDGGRFSLLVDDDVIDGARLTEAKRREFADLIQELIHASRSPHDVESTLRCTLVYEDQVAEVLLSPVRGELRAVGQTRARRREDDRTDRAAPRLVDRVRHLGWRAAAIAGLILAAGLLAVRDGALDPFLRPAPETLEVRLGPFDGLLAAELTDAWPGYRLRISRGSRYPRSVADAEELTRSAATLAARAAAIAIGDGGSAFARLVGADGTDLGAAVFRTSPLLASDAPFEVALPGRRAAVAVELTLDAR